MTCENMNWFNLILQQHLLPNSALPTMTFPRFSVDWSKEILCWPGALEIILYFHSNYLSTWGGEFYIDDNENKKKQI